MSKPESDTAIAARLIAEMMEAQSWHPARDCADHPILGPAIALREKTYAELRMRDFTTARLAADEAAVRFIMEAVYRQGQTP